MTDFFFYGTLCHPPLVRAVLGREVRAEPAALPGHAVHVAELGAFPMIVAGGAGAPGVLVRGLGAEDVARLDFYEAGFGFDTRDMRVDTAAGPATARVYFPQPGLWRPGAPWDLAAWVARWGAVVTAAAEDFMAQRGIVAPEKLWARYGMMLIRAGARLRAEAEAGQVPMTLRRRAATDDVSRRHGRQVYANYFSVEEFDLRFRHFDGGMSPEVNRGVFVAGDAVVVLPYDPVRDRVLLIEQFRMGPHGRGDPQPWLLEAPAGRVDGGETPETAARREAEEEARLVLRALVPALHHYPSPGCVAEYLYTYVGLADLPDGAAGVAGLPTEAEDIRSHLVSFDRLMAMVETGEVNNGPLILLAYWLARNRARLRADAGLT
ncbi:MAG: NUDIX domain-containing protein [Rhodobacteraceae bacterium]|uniref:NUDIX domain-containing protein n=1 Tax=Albidovulum sp. TaxID=1872424 RepID=UPI001DEA9115|nr:NUDIX domain-containing protein [uncultured Defluviimonas sp.]MCB2126152.1 NUDIX domain-containing protein [Paracoccaceae bacterium]